MSSVLLLAGVTQAYATDATSASPPPPAAQTAQAPQFKHFKIGNNPAIALKDGALQEPNDGKSFVVGEPTDDRVPECAGRH